MQQSNKSESPVDQYLPEDGSAAVASGGAPHVGGGPKSLLDLGLIRAVLWRQKLVIIFTVAIAVIMGLVVTLLMTPVYKSTATMRFDVDTTRITEGELEPSIAPNEYFRYAQTLVDVLQSRQMALRVVDAMNLTAEPLVMGEDFPQTKPSDMSTEVWEEARRMHAAEVLMENVEAQAQRETRIIPVTYSSSSPQLSARLANGYVAQFLANEVEQKIEGSSYALTYLQEEIAETRNDLQEAELRAIDYARSNRIVGQNSAGGGGEESSDPVSAGAPSSITVSDLASASESFAEARTARVVAEQEWRAVQSVPPSQIPQVQQDARVSDLQAQLTAVRRELAKLRERYRDDYPQVRELAAQEQVLEDQVSQAGTEIKRSIQRNFEIARAREQALANEVDQASERTLDEQDRRVQYNLIDREASALRSQLQALLRRYNEIASASNLQSNNITALDDARVPTSPSSPNLIRNLLVALLLGIGAAAGLAVLRELFDDKLRTSDDLENRLGILALGQTPFVDDDVNSELDSSFSFLSEAYSSIRATLDYALAGVDHPVVQFTSSFGGEGKSTTAFALAKTYAGIGRKVLLVDFDLRRPSVHRFFERKNKQKGDVVDVIYGRVRLESAVERDVSENLDVLTTGRIPPNPTGILSSGLVKEFLDKHRHEYDIVILDTSPVMGIADAPLLSRFSDAVVFVIEANNARLGQARAALRRLADVDANVVGAILTKYQALQAGDSYNYQYRYYRYE